MELKGEITNEQKKEAKEAVGIGRTRYHKKYLVFSMQ